MSDQLPYISINQSIICLPRSDTLALTLDIKILPDKNIPVRPFYGIWLLDVSGSMSGNRIQRAKESLIKQVESLPAETNFNLVLFQSTVKVIIQNETISSQTRPRIIEHIEQISAVGGTALHGALKQGIKMVRDYKGPLTKKIILITDGEPGDVRVKVGDQDDSNYKQYFNLAHEALEYKASIDTVGALGEHNVYLLYEIAKLSTGKYIFAKNADELKTKMLIATEQTTRIMFSQPSLEVFAVDGKVTVDDAVQYKPTIIRMPFEKIPAKLKRYKYKTWLRSFEAGDTYQFLVKVRLNLDKKVLKDTGNQHILDVKFNMGKKNLDVTKEIFVKFSDQPADHRINMQINKKFAQYFSTAQEITEQTIKNDAEGTQRIQGDETKKISG